MNTHFVADDRLARLAYVVRISADDVTIRHGRQVETHANWATDGAWDGDAMSPPSEQSYLLGTAVVVDGDRDEVMLLSSQSPIDRLLLVQLDGEVVASNSLPALLAAIDDRLDPNCVTYRTRNLSADLGVNAAAVNYRTLRRRTIRQLLNSVVRVRHGVVSARHRDVEGPFHSYDHYRNYLGQTVSAIVANAQDERRRHPFIARPSLSAGYDSGAVAVLAAEAGCTSAFTLLRYADESKTELVDYPGKIAERLGLELIEVERDQWRDGGAEPSMEMAAAGASFMDVALLTYERHLDATLLLVGYGGDNIWGKDNFRCYADTVQGSGHFCGRGLTEHRLSHGYILFGAPLIGHTAHPSLHRISNSAELAAWDVGGDYNRPIARRIIEDAGIRRGEFATKKYSGSARVGNSRKRYVGSSRAERRDELSEVMTEPAIESFLSFVDAETAAGRALGNRRVRTRLAVGRIGFVVYEKLDAATYRVGRRLHRWGIKSFVPRRVMIALSAQFRLHADYTYLLPHWGSEHLAQRIREGTDPETSTSTDAA